MSETKEALELVLNELRSLKSDLKKSDAKNDDRFELIKTEFETVKARIGETNERLDRIESKLDGTYEQAGKTHEELVALKARVVKLEGPSA